MRTKFYTFFVASNDQSRILKLRIPHYVLHLLAGLAIVGSITVVAAVGSYTRMLWKADNYNAVRSERDTLKQQFSQLQTSVKDTNQRLNSLQSLATEVAMTYGFMRLRETPFGLSESAVTPEEQFDHTVDQFNFLEKNATSIALAKEGLHLLPPQPGLGDATFTPSLWPVAGQITASFGERLDPFNGEGEFHTGVDISASYGQSVHVAADGVVISSDNRPGYGRLVVVDHGFGTTTWYGHLSGFNVQGGQQVRRGDVIGYAGTSGRSTGPHVHYEIRLNGAPVNPWRYLRFNSFGD
ncbi:MAG TPA: M23 family metallopeptidase [Candidatus Acidoferrales bacterium]|jgi:murein DD-endopeptidase MepM/ murein hydrolase activator NlpD|nr:M23 family metallopeptidase [Candidatus Acidoferrales bacterium]